MIRHPSPIPPNTRLWWWLLVGGVVLAPVILLHYAGSAHRGAPDYAGIIGSTKLLLLVPAVVSAIAGWFIAFRFSLGARIGVTLLFVLAGCTISLAVLFAACGIPGNRTQVPTAAEKKADETIMHKTDDLLVHLLGSDAELRAKFGNFQRMERLPLPFHDLREKAFDHDEICFARAAIFDKARIRVAVEIGYPASPELGDRSVRIDSWRIFTALDGATRQPMVCLTVRPTLEAPDAPRQTASPRLDQ